MTTGNTSGGNKKSNLPKNLIQRAVDALNADRQHERVATNADRQHEREATNADRVHEREQFAQLLREAQTSTAARLTLAEALAREMQRNRQLEQDIAAEGKRYLDAGYAKYRQDPLTPDDYVCEVFRNHDKETVDRYADLIRAGNLPPSHPFVGAMNDVYGPILQQAADDYAALEQERNDLVDERDRTVCERDFAAKLADLYLAGQEQATEERDQARQERDSLQDIINNAAGAAQGLLDAVNIVPAPQPIPTPAPQPAPVPQPAPQPAPVPVPNPNDREQDIARRQEEWRRRFNGESSSTSSPIEVNISVPPLIRPMDPVYRRPQPLARIDVNNFADRHQRRGYRAFQAGDYATAVDHFGTSVRDASHELQIAHARSLWNTSDYLGAERIYASLVGADDVARYLETDIPALVEASQPNRARNQGGVLSPRVAHAYRLVAPEDRQSDAWKWIAESYEQRGDAVNAARAANTLCDRYPSDIATALRDRITLGLGQ